MACAEAAAGAGAARRGAASADRPRDQRPWFGSRWWLRSKCRQNDLSADIRLRHSRADLVSTDL